MALENYRFGVVDGNIGNELPSNIGHIDNDK